MYASLTPAFPSSQDNNYLLRVLNFLMECHRRFYMLPENDPRRNVKFILDEQRAEILRYAWSFNQ